MYHCNSNIAISIFYLYKPGGGEPGKQAAKKMNTYKKAINAIINYFEEDEELFNDCIEELDGWNGYLGDDRYYEMEMLDEFYHDTEPSELLFRAFYGYDEDYTDKDGNHNEPFNPNKPYFRYNGYGNLVSAYSKNYSDRLDHWVVEQMAEYRQHIYSIGDDEELLKLFDDLEEAKENE